ncbi:disease resistance protein L6-like [Rutidosis leptorrhynchoides]|uniref:disease resistance protein L6-like n=1 Tax=Rutidosis leptorrhynchoides TaxID=125765 RepID=UPI003A99689E
MVVVNGDLSVVRGDMFYETTENKDTGNKFVSHLKAALESKCFNISDHTTHPIGQDVCSAQLKAIEESHTYLVVFSPKYALSVEFFEKLVLIMDSVSKFNDRKVIPVFLNVDLSDVRKLQGCFEEDFRKHEVANVDSQTLNKWIQAVKYVGGLSGLFLKKGDDESDFIKKIVQHLMKIKIPEEQFDAKYPVGIEPQKQAIISKLRLGDKEFSNTVAVLGISGSGKTTIVKAVYDTIVADFDCSCFIENIPYKNSGRKWKVKLQREVLRSLTGDDSFHNNASTAKIKRVVENNKALVVLDGVEKPDELEVLGIPSASLSCSGSRVVVATGNKESLRDLSYTRHDMELLNKEDSFTLFVAHAYGEDVDDVDEEFVYEIVDHAGGLPLVLVVWGKHFKAHEKEQWQTY